MIHPRVIYACMALALAATCADAVLTATDPGFAVASVIPTWLSASIAFTSDGSLWSIHASNGCLYKFANVSGNPSPSTVPVQTSTYCLGGSSWDWGLVSTASDRLFTAAGLEVTAMKTGGSPVQYFDLLPAAGTLSGNVRGIARHPATGDLFIAGNPVGYIYKVANPDSNPAPLIAARLRSSGNQFGPLDGIAVDADSTIYVAASNQSYLLAVTTSGYVESALPSGEVPAGVAVARDASNNTFVVTSHGRGHTLSKWTGTNPTLFVQSNIAVTGTNNEFITVGPDHCMYVTSVGGPDGVIRLSQANGACFN